MPQFFVDAQFDIGEEIAVRGSDAKHITAVLRLAAGDWLILSDGAGKSFRGEIRSATNRSVIVRIVEEVTRRAQQQPPVLAHAIIKHDRTEMIIQKAVELGIQHIIPFQSARTIPRLTAGITDAKLNRWRRIAREAAQQSGLPVLPAVDPPQTFDRLIGSATRFDTVLMFWEGERRRDIASLRERLCSRGTILLIIGPEGGFSPAEVHAATEQGALTVSLGHQILRVETASIAALSICLYETGGFNLGEAP